MPARFNADRGKVGAGCNESSVTAVTEQARGRIAPAVPY
jgi:hypothetical protein